MVLDDTKHLDEMSLNMDIEGFEDDDDNNDGGAEVNNRETVPNDESTGNDSHVVRSDRPVLTARMLENKAEFERKRNEILDDVPQSAKARFGNIYFSKFVFNFN